MLIHNIQKGKFSFLKCELFLNRKRFLHKTLCILIYKITYVFRHIAWFSLRFLMFREISVYMLLFCYSPIYCAPDHRKSAYSSWDKNHVWNCSWNQPVLSNKGKVSCPRKQRGHEPKTSTLQLSQMCNPLHHTALV